MPCTVQFDISFSHLVGGFACDFDLLGRFNIRRLMASSLPPVTIQHDGDLPSTQCNIIEYSNLAQTLLGTAYGLQVHIYNSQCHSASFRPHSQGYLKCWPPRPRIPWRSELGCLPVAVFALEAPAQAFTRRWGLTCEQSPIRWNIDSYAQFRTLWTAWLARFCFRQPRTC